jgi:hypothetical protein
LEGRPILGGFAELLIEMTETTLFSSRWIIALAVVVVIVVGVVVLVLLLGRD